jgi:hypothetical protein
MREWESERWGGGVVVFGGSREREWRHGTRETESGRERERVIEVQLIRRLEGVRVTGTEARERETERVRE